MGPRITRSNPQPNPATASDSILPTAKSSPTGGRNRAQAQKVTKGTAASTASPTSAVDSGGNCMTTCGGTSSTTRGCISPTATAGPQPVAAMTQEEIAAMLDQLALAGFHLSRQPCGAAETTARPFTNSTGTDSGDVEGSIPDDFVASRDGQPGEGGACDKLDDDEMSVLQPGMGVSAALNGEKTDDDSDTVTPLISRPDGTAGSDYSIQEAMGLAGIQTSVKHQTYLSIVRRIHDLVIAAQLNCEKEWKAIPQEDKGKLYRVARTAIPFLQRFVNDWATEEIAKRYLKNKRQYLYRTGELTRPAKYAHLKANAAKRDRDGSRRKKALVNAEAAKQAKAKKLAASAARKARKAAKKHATAVDDGMQVDGEN
ncbi:hypothetical protein HDZ31DRAFT_66677 [Schizophyllum fasciatum]